MSKVTTMPAPFLLELHSERMADALIALAESGFDVKHVMGTTNRFRIEDAQEIEYVDVTKGHQ